METIPQPPSLIKMGIAAQIVNIKHEGISKVCYIHGLCQLDAHGEQAQFVKMSDMELYRRLGRAVADRRAELGLTQSEVADKLGLSRASLANLENGRQRIMVHQLFALVNALKLKSILDLVPEAWVPSAPLPEIQVSGTPLSPQEQTAVESLLASAFAEERLRKRAS